MQKNYGKEVPSVKEHGDSDDRRFGAFVQTFLVESHCRPVTYIDFMVVLAAPMIEESRDVLWNKIVFIIVGL